jgi:myo-inositol-1(or 4)-monophosphatase
MSTSTADATLIADLSALAQRFAAGAGEVARAGRQRSFAVDTKSSATDVVTEVDRQVERWLVSAILAARPHDGVLGEEGSDTHGTSRVRWVIDPIDGTVNFTLGLRQYAVSVAVELDGQVVAGCVRNPELGDTFRAERGGGAYLERAGELRRLSGPRSVPLARCVVGTGFAYAAPQRVRQARVLERVVGRIGDIRRLGAASLDLCALAAGELDGYYEVGLNPWDYAAGLLIAQEAGCRSTGLRGRDAGTAFTAVAGQSVAEEFFTMLEQVDADLPDAV